MRARGRMFGDQSDAPASPAAHRRSGRCPATWSAMNTAFFDFIDRCQRQTDGFVATSPSDSWRLGAVVMAQHAGDFVTVRASPADRGGYGSGGLHALPGGMVWTAIAPRKAGVMALLEASLRTRMLEETSLASAATLAISFCGLGPVVSGVLVKGQPRFALIAPYSSRLAERAALQAGDHSANASAWVSCASVPWDGLAPANSVIVAHRLWAILADRERERARPHVARSVAQCAHWATLARLPVVPHPWDGPGPISAWRTAWKAIG